jgi:hypothetical protein
VFDEDDDNVIPGSHDEGRCSNIWTEFRGERREFRFFMLALKYFEQRKRVCGGRVKCA